MNVLFWGLFINIKGELAGKPPICYGAEKLNGIMTMFYELTLGIN
jgi:hypothetical protein